MSQAQQYGPERAMMQSPHGAGQFVRGSGNINAKLAQGWTIVENDRNHLTDEMHSAILAGLRKPAEQALTEHYGEVPRIVYRDPKESTEAQKPVPIDIDPVKTETGKRGPGRRRKNQQTNQ